MSESSTHAVGESGDDALKCSSSLRDQPQDGELDIKQLDEEVCTLRDTVQDLLSQSTELDHKRSNLLHELHLLHSMINDKRSRATVQNLVEFHEQLKDLERQESGLDSKLLICEEEFSNLSGSKSGFINLDIYLTDSINNFDSLKKFKDAMTTPSGRSKLLDTMEVILKGTKQKLEKAKLDLLAEQKVFNSLEEKHAIEVAAERNFSVLLKTFQDACTEYERLRELAST